MVTDGSEKNKLHRGPWSNCMLVQIQLYQGHLTRVIWVGLNVTPNHLRCECEEAIAC